MGRAEGDRLIEFRDGYKSFRGQSVLRGLNLGIRQGETFTILGGSGSGKTVCLKHMIGLLRVDSGQVIIDGQEITPLSELELVEVRKSFSLVFQSAALFDSLSVFENVAYPLREHRYGSNAEISERVEACLDAVGLQGVESKMPSELSGGMRKRVGVARGIALEPRAILYDEPTTGLDILASSAMIDFIETRRAAGTCVLFSTHILSEAERLCERIGVIHKGRMLAVGTLDELRERTGREWLEDVFKALVASAEAGEPDASEGPNSEGPSGEHEEA